MTDDYKNTLLKYLTGGLTIGTGANTPQFLTPTSSTNNIKTKLDTYFYSYTIYGSLQGKDVNNNGLPLNVIYGGYATSIVDTTLRGFIYILDTDFAEIQMITEYTGGTALGIIETLSVADDGTFYGAEKVGTVISPTPRLIMLNNFLLKLPGATEYEVIYRISYNIPTTNDGYITNQVIKNENAGYYFISGTEPNVSSERQPVGYQLQIIVEADNVWTEFKKTTETRDFALASTIASWNTSNVITFKMIGWLSDDAGGRNYVEYSNNVSNNLVEYMITPAVSNITYYSALIISDTTTYVEYATGVLPTLELESIYLGYIDYNTNSIVNIFTLPSASILENSSFYFFKCNDQPFYALITTFESVPVTKYKIVIGKIIGSNYYEQELATEEGVPFVSAYVSIFSMTNQFNLYDYYVQVNNKVYSTKQIYNVLNYNGLSYVDTTSLVPNSAILYDSGDIPIFARNLYNLSLNDNTTTATIEIPNNFLNDITIATESLFGETNTEMVENVENITKNVYESVLMNFINTIMVKNTDTNILSKEGSIRLNDSVSQTNDYANARALKMNIQYSDGTSLIYNISASQISYVGNEATCLIAYYVPTGKTVVNLQIMSYDEATIYNNSPVNWTEQKYYTMSQKVEVV